jgi:hypothetical protein
MSELPADGSKKEQPAQKPIKQESEEAKARVFAWLEENPELLARMDELREVARNQTHAHDKLSQAEAAFVKILGGLGRGVVSNWLAVRDAQEQERLLREDAPPRARGAKARKHSKKNLV